MVVFSGGPRFDNILAQGWGIVRHISHQRMSLHAAWAYSNSHYQQRLDQQYPDSLGC